MQVKYRVQTNTNIPMQGKNLKKMVWGEINHTEVT